MKIIVDCRYTRLERHDGISRYTARIVDGAGPRSPRRSRCSSATSASSTMLPDLPWVLVSAPTSAREPWVARQLNTLQAGCRVHAPCRRWARAGRRYGLVMTLHDLIYYRNRTPPRDLTWPIRLLWRLYHLAWWPQRLLLNRADEVVTVSETTKELMRAAPAHQAADHDRVATPRTSRPADHPRARAAGHPRPALHGLVHALQERRDAGARDARAAGLPPAPAERHLRRRPGAARGARARRSRSCSTTASATRSTPSCSRTRSRWCTRLARRGLRPPARRGDGGRARRSSSATSRSSARSGRMRPATSRRRIRMPWPRAVRALEDPSAWQRALGRGARAGARYDWDRSAAELLEVLARVAQETAHDLGVAEQRERGGFDGEHGGRAAGGGPHDRAARAGSRRAPCAAACRARAAERRRCSSRSPA